MTDLRGKDPEYPHTINLDDPAELRTLMQKAAGMAPKEPAPKDDRRAANDPDFAKAVQGGLDKPTFRRYYALRASSTVSRGAHDEWNIIRLINDRRRADPRLGTPGQIPILFDGQGVAPPQFESPVSDGYVGRCTP